jgi:hypothetical protein
MCKRQNRLRSLKRSRKVDTFLVLPKMFLTVIGESVWSFPGSQQRIGYAGAPERGMERRKEN